MKFRVTFKDPDGVYESINDQAGSDEQAEKMWEMISKFCRYSEYATIEFDTDAGTATVVPV